MWLERLTVNAVVATVLGSIPASSDTMESGGGGRWSSVEYRTEKEKNPTTAYRQLQLYIVRWYRKVFFLYMQYSVHFPQF